MNRKIIVTGALVAVTAHPILFTRRRDALAPDVHIEVERNGPTPAVQSAIFTNVEEVRSLNVISEDYWFRPIKWAAPAPVLRPWEYGDDSQLAALFTGPTSH